MNTNDNPINCDELISHLPGWLNDDLSTAERAAIELHLAGCPACQQELATTRQLWQRMAHVPTPQPGPQVRTQFYAMLEQVEADEKAILSSTAPIRRAVDWLLPNWSGRWISDQLSSKRITRLAYSVLLVGIGVLAGYWVQRRQTPTVASLQQIDTLSKQIQEMRQMMLLSLLENPAASERLRAVSYTDEINQVDGQVIDALLTTLNNDDNVNVRLVTLEALAKLADKAKVREGLVQSITRQESPLVQSALADVMVKLQEKRSLKPLRQLLHDDKLNHLVKGKIEQSIKDLS